MKTKLNLKNMKQDMKKWLYMLLALVALIAIVLTLSLLRHQQRTVPEAQTAVTETAAPASSSASAGASAVSPIPATATPEPTEIPPAITPPADQAASGTDIILQPVLPATDGDIEIPASADGQQP